MKGLTLTQPWASLVAFGEKKIETRNWGTSYRGPIAIHAGKGLGGIRRPDGRPGREEDLEILCATEPFTSALRLHLGEHSAFKLRKLLPRGLVIATADLVAVVPTEPVDVRFRIIEIDEMANEILRYPDLSEQERAFGNYGPGRYAWVLGRIRPVEVPTQIPPGCVGTYLGLWDVPPSVAARLAP